MVTPKKVRSYNRNSTVSTVCLIDGLVTSLIATAYYNMLQFDSVTVDRYRTRICYHASAGYEALHNSQYPTDVIQTILKEALERCNSLVL
ncbi:hypothetical protein BDR03DRAFT_939008 [Suillus americanus]|nr:hypothetical protein BDR03DRAFT_939008 [Suillus americanus]